VATHRILVIDDSRVIRMRVKDMLPGNFEVLEAKDGLEGFNLIRSANPNLIMLDFLLPKMSGWEVYQEIQKDPALQAIPLVLMSGRKEEVTEKLPEPFESFAFVEKPFEKKHLIGAIKEAMKKASERPAAVPVAAPTGDSSAVAQEVQQLRAKVNKMEAEINNLKKQMTQLVGFIKQKLR
jgi:CheY-like chemotaxis protein